MTNISSKKPKILYPISTTRTEIPSHLPEFQQFLLDFNVIFHPLTTQEAFIKDLKTKFNDIDGMYGSESLHEIEPFANLVPHFPESMKVFAFPWVGYTCWAPELMKSRGIIITNIGDGAAEDVADVAMVLTLNVFRFTNFVELQFRNQDVLDCDEARKIFGGTGVDLKGRPKELGPYDDRTKGCFIGGKHVSSPRGKVAGIIGLGTIGKEIAIRLNAIGMKIKYFKRSPLTEEELLQFHFDLEYIPSIEELLPQVDLLMLAVPETPSTIDLINDRTIKLFKRGARIVNVGRGSAIDEDVLLKALDDGTITAFGTDVFRNEPRIDPRFKDRFDVSILPHVGSFTTENFDISNIRVIENLRNILIDGGKGLNVCV